MSKSPRIFTLETNQAWNSRFTKVSPSLFKAILFLEAKTIAKFEIFFLRIFEKVAVSFIICSTIDIHY